MTDAERVAFALARREGGAAHTELPELVQKRGSLSTFFARQMDDNERLIVDRKPFRYQIVKKERP